MQGHLRVALQSEQTSQNCWKTSTAKQWSSLRIRTGRTEPSRLGLTLERVFPEDAVFSSTGFPGPSPPAISHAGGAGLYIHPSVPSPVLPAVFLIRHSVKVLCPFMNAMLSSLRKPVIREMRIFINLRTALTSEGCWFRLQRDQRNKVQGLRTKISSEFLSLPLLFFSSVLAWRNLQTPLKNEGTPRYGFLVILVWVK